MPYVLMINFNLLVKTILYIYMKSEVCDISIWLYVWIYGVIFLHVIHGVYVANEKANRESGEITEKNNKRLSQRL
jgi:hypothetical protein